MSKLGFRVHVEGSNLVATTFPAQGGGAIVRQTWSLDSLNLNENGDTPPAVEVPANEIAGSERTSLEVKIDYSDKSIKVVPVNRMDSRIESYAIKYDFSDLGLESERDYGESKLLAERDKPELNKDETWP